MYALLRFPPQGRFYNVVHRWSGRVAILLTLPVAYHCIFLLGFGTYSTRVYVHSLLGSSLYGAFLAKLLIVRTKVSQAGTANSRRSAVLHPLGVVAHFCILVLQHIWHRSVARAGRVLSRAHFRFFFAGVLLIITL